MTDCVRPAWTTLPRALMSGPDVTVDSRAGGPGGNYIAANLAVLAPGSALYKT